MRRSSPFSMSTRLADGLGPKRLPYAKRQYAPRMVPPFPEHPELDMARNTPALGGLSIWAWGRAQRDTIDHRKQRFILMGVGNENRRAPLCTGLRLMWRSNSFSRSTKYMGGKQECSVRGQAIPAGAPAARPSVVSPSHSTSGRSFAAHRLDPRVLRSWA